MTNDYAARKGGKRKRKPPPGTVDFISEAKLGGNKERPKRAKVRRLCRGHCFQEPVVKDEDKSWPQEEMVEGAQTRGSRRSELPIVVPGQPPKKVVEKDAKLKKNRRRGKRRRVGHNLSTDVNLDIPNVEGGPETAASKLLESSSSLEVYPDGIQRYMANEGFIEATPVQEGCWPLIRDGGDLIGVAEPGSGKTLAFLLPAAIKIASWMALPDAGQPPWAVVLVPTRELANQIAVACRPLYKLHGIRTAHIYGGVDKTIQIEALERNPHIIVATPGRTVELVKEGHLNLEHVKYVVLDEGDKLLSPGLIEDCEVLRQAMFHNKDVNPQVVVFSATMPERAIELASQWMKSPSTLEFRPSARSVSQTITQVVHICAEHKKPGKLQKHLEMIKEMANERRQKPRIIIFANTVKAVRFLEGLLKDDLKVVMLHGKRTQVERNQAIQDFKAGKCQVLIATDVASRGLHIRNLPYIINYDFPSRLETYIHRVGRTGRLAAYGHAYSFFTRNLAKLAPDLVDLLEHHHQPIDPNLLMLASAFQTADTVLKELDSKENDESDALEEILSDFGRENDCPGDEIATEGTPSSDILTHMSDALLKTDQKGKSVRKVRKKGLLGK